MHLPVFTRRCIIGINVCVQVYAGLGNGTVKQYDLRRSDPEDCISVFECSENYGIHSLVTSTGRIYGSTRQSVLQWDENNKGEEISRVDGSIESLAYDSDSKCLASSVRPQFENGLATHDLWNLRENKCSKVRLCKSAVELSIMYSCLCTLYIFRLCSTPKGA